MPTFNPVLTSAGRKSKRLVESPWTVPCWSPFGRQDNDLEASESKTLPAISSHIRYRFWPAWGVTGVNKDVVDMVNALSSYCVHWQTFRVETKMGFLRLRHYKMAVRNREYWECGLSEGVLKSFGWNKTMAHSLKRFYWVHGRICSRCRWHRGVNSSLVMHPPLLMHSCLWLERVIFWAILNCPCSQIVEI